MNSVASVVAHNTVSVRLNVLLYDITDLAEALTRSHDFDGLTERLVRHLDQFLVFFGYVADKKRLVQIAMEVTMVHGHIDIAQIAVLLSKNP